MQRLCYVVTAFVASVALMLGTALTAWAAEVMTLTFIRHGESQANFEDRIDTSVPGPDLTDLGREQAETVADTLVANSHDGTYASNMVRTQQTAQPLTDQMPGHSIVVLPGLREISAGVFEGSPERSGLGRLGYAAAPAAWMLGARFVPVLGSPDGDGNAFDARVDDAIQVIYDSGDRNPAVFSHGATIMFWTMMNVDNPDIGLLLSHQLGNTAVVVITGNPDDGWTLTNWDGVEVSAEPSLLTKLFVDFRDVVTAPQTALYRIQQAFAAGDVAGLADAVRDGVGDVANQVVGFVPKVINDVVGSVQPDNDLPTESAGIDATAETRTQVRSVPDEDDPVPTAFTVDNEKSTAASDLTRGNKFHPGQTLTADDEEKQSDSLPDAPDEPVGTAADTPDPSAETPESGTATSDNDSESGEAAAA